MTNTSVPALTLNGGEERRSNIALQMGGALWIVYYVLQLVMGFLYGAAQVKGKLGLLDGVCFLAAIFCLDLGLGLLARSLGGRAWAAKVGLLFAFIATAGVVGSVVMIMRGYMPQIWGGIGVIGTCLSTLFVALATRRLQVWSARRSLLLLLIGALTFPLILLFIIPGQFVPTFLTDELPFAISGAAFIVFARLGEK
ncbi:hypothetical protein IAD21_06354 [Abditibacteriota bacterium]|nr:hypothetical protein IAD21_06354 [Abditibacteriota bacterium]